MCEIIMSLHNQSQKITHFGNNVFCLDFINPLQNHCLFHKSLAKIVHVLELFAKKLCIVISVMGDVYVSFRGEIND